MKSKLENRTKIIKARVTENEKCLLETKCKYYGYKNLSKYLIDAAIYEKVTYVDIMSKKELYDSYANNTKEIKKIVKEIRHLCKYATQINDDDIKNIKSLMFKVIKNQKEMLKIIESKLDLKVWVEINRNKQI